MKGVIVRTAIIALMLFVVVAVYPQSENRAELLTRADFLTLSSLEQYIMAETIGVATLLLLPAFLQLLQREGLMRKVRFTNLALAAAVVALLLFPVLRRPQIPPEGACKWDPNVDPNIPSTCPIRCGPSYYDVIPGQIRDKSGKTWYVCCHREYRLDYKEGDYICVWAYPEED